MVKMLRKIKKVIAMVLTAGMIAGAISTSVMAESKGWKKNSIGWWYQNADGSYLVNQWEKINGAWYYFNEKGYMIENDWAKDNSGKWYYLGTDGAMKSNAWVQDKAGKWYYVGADGAMKSNAWEQDRAGKWYYVGADGSMKSNAWVQDKAGRWYYVGADGVMKINEWIEESGKRYYVGADGAMVTDDSKNDNTVSTKIVTIGDLTYAIDESWELDTTGSLVDSIDGLSTAYLIPSYNKMFQNNLIVVVEDYGREISEEILLTDWKESYIREYERFGITVISDTIISTECGNAFSLTMDATGMVDKQIPGYTAYMKIVRFTHGTKGYTFQLFCGGDGGNDFAMLESQFDAVISSISK